MMLGRMERMSQDAPKRGQTSCCGISTGRDWIGAHLVVSSFSQAKKKQRMKGDEDEKR